MPITFAGRGNWNSIYDVDNRNNEVYAHAQNGTEVGITVQGGNKYFLTDDYFGAFQINKWTGVVTVKDSSKLAITNSEVRELPVSYKTVENAYQWYSSNGNKAVTLTEAYNYEKGGYFSNGTVNLSKKVDFEFYVNLGTRQSQGADGIVFFLNNKAPTIGATGGYMGYSAGTNSQNRAMSNSLAVEFDTWLNGEWNSDKNSNHVAVISNGYSNHSEAYNNNNTLEDGKWYFVNIKWDPSINKFEVYFDNKKIKELNENIIATYLGGNENAYFGFTAATGAGKNRQSVYNPVVKTAASPTITVTSQGAVQEFEINIKSGGQPINAVDDFGTAKEDANSSILVCDRTGPVISYDPASNTKTQLFDFDDDWFDIASLNGVLYGITNKGFLYKNIDGNKSKIHSLGSGVNSLVAHNGKLFYMSGKQLKYYNPSSNNVSHVMKVDYYSAGDLAYHNGKMYLAEVNGKLIEIDLERLTATEIADNLPQTNSGAGTVFGLASSGGKFYIVHNHFVSEYSIENKQVVQHYSMADTGIYVNQLNGAALGNGGVSGNVLTNDSGSSTLRVKKVNTLIIGDTASRTQEFQVNGNYGTLFIKPDGSYRYVVNNDLDVVQRLNQGQYLDEVFNCVVGYPSTTTNDSNSVLNIRIWGETDQNQNVEKALHLDALDIDGNGSSDEIYTKSKVSVWNDSANYNNKATSSNTPEYKVNAIGNMAGVDFKNTNGWMTIETHSEVNNAIFTEKSFAYVIKTGADVSGTQVIYEQGGPVRGYNLVIAPDPQNSNKPALWGMIYNNNANEWTHGEFYKEIKLTDVTPETVYTVFFVHDANKGTFKAYINGDFSTVTNAGSVDKASQQYAHPNPIGVGGINSQSIHPVTHQVMREGASVTYKGIIGEIISWNKLLSFDDVSRVSGDLNKKWKTPDAPTSLTAKQNGDELIVQWPAISGAIEYELYLSTDGTIDPNDAKYTTATNGKTITLQEPYKSMDNVKIILRYKTTSKTSEALVQDQKILKKPTNFRYYEANGEYVFTFDKEDGKTYALTTNDENYTYTTVEGKVTVTAAGIDPSKAKLYEVSNVNNTASYENGHSAPATPPTAINVPKITGLTGTFNNGVVSLSWNGLSNASDVDSYEVLMGDNGSTMSTVAKGISGTSKDVALDILNKTVKYFKVVAKMKSGVVYEYSLPSDVIEVTCEPTNFDGIQEENNFKFTWDQITGAQEYEIYISNDGVISDDDEKIVGLTGGSATKAIPSRYLNNDKVNLIFRVKKGNQWSTPIVRERKVFKMPSGFVYTHIGSQYKLSLNKEAGKAYVIKIPGTEDAYLINNSSVTIPDTLDITKALAYEVSYDNGTASYDNGHGVPATPPTEINVSKVTGLMVTDSVIDQYATLKWDLYPNATGYEVFVSESLETVKTGSPINAEAIDANTSTYKYYVTEAQKEKILYFTVRAKLSNGLFSTSDFADPVELNRAEYVDSRGVSGIAVGSDSAAIVENKANIAEYEQGIVAMATYAIKGTKVFDPIIEFEVDDIQHFNIEYPVPSLEKLTLSADGTTVTSVDVITHFSSTVTYSEKDGKRTMNVRFFDFAVDGEVQPNTVFRAKIKSQVVAKALDDAVKKINEKNSAKNESIISSWEIQYDVEEIIEENEVIKVRTRMRWNKEKIENLNPGDQTDGTMMHEIELKLKNRESYKIYLYYKKGTT